MKVRAWGYGDLDGPGVMNTGKTFGKIDDRVTKLTIVPQLRMLKVSANPSEQTENGNALGESVVSSAVSVVANHKELTLEPILINLEK